MCLDRVDNSHLECIDLDRLFDLEECMSLLDRNLAEYKSLRRQLDSGHFDWHLSGCTILAEYMALDLNRVSLDQRLPVVSDIVLLSQICPDFHLDIERMYRQFAVDNLHSKNIVLTDSSKINVQILPWPG